MKSKHITKLWCYEVAKAVEEGKLARIKRKVEEREEEKKTMPKPKSLADHIKEQLQILREKGFFPEKK